MMEAQSQTEIDILKAVRGLYNFTGYPIIPMPNYTQIHCSDSLTAVKHFQRMSTLYEGYYLLCRVWLHLFPSQRPALPHPTSWYLGKA